MRINLSLKNVPEEIYERVKTSAKQNRRSMNSEIIACLETAFTPEPTRVADLLARIRKVRPVLRSGKAKPKDIRKFIEAGRP